MRPIRAAAVRKLGGADTPARMAGTLACNSWQIPSSVLELRHAALVADNWFHASRDGGPANGEGRERERSTRLPVYPQATVRAWNWKVFAGGTIYRARRARRFAAEEKRMHPGSRCCGLNTTGHRRGRAIAVWRIYFIVSSDGPGTVSNANVKTVKRRKISTRVIAALRENKIRVSKYMATIVPQSNILCPEKKNLTENLFNFL